MNTRKRDPAPWLLAGCAALTLSGVSALALPARAAPAAVAAPAALDDGDGDELLEHWGDARYAREQRVQMAGMVLFFGGAAAVSLRRRAARRRGVRHG